MSQIILKDVIVKHNIPVRTQYNTTHVIVFYDPKTHYTWCWKTAIADSLRYKEHLTYSIIGSDEGNFRLSRVNEISFDRSKDAKDVESEQEGYVASEKINALDILLPDMDLTNEEKYDIIVLRKEAR